ncbi:hypothetical protein [Williamsia sp. 1135]|uniref:hypothetical protein n=1 Tax=Williamsia sp. 1135 TaxID=1889262 RepID=UPI000A1055C4|nr:hypothetical protein [Williamsia sp. 1135]ORM37780.1 hypothetical protein BFL43_02985 [Williamsia sp. 1135]
METPEELLRDIQQSLTDAYAEPVASERRRSFAHHATTQASDLIMRDESTPEQRKQGSAYLEQSLALQAEFEPAQRVRPHQRNRPTSQRQGPSVASLLDAIADHSNKTPVRRASVCHEPTPRQESGMGEGLRQQSIGSQLEA